MMTFGVCFHNTLCTFHQTLPMLTFEACVPHANLRKEGRVGAPKGGLVTHFFGAGFALTTVSPLLTCPSALNIEQRSHQFP